MQDSKKRTMTERVECENEAKRTKLNEEGETNEDEEDEVEILEEEEDMDASGQNGKEEGASSARVEEEAATSSTDDRRQSGVGGGTRGLSHSFRRDPTKFHLLIGVTGSVAAIKLLDLVAELHRQSPSNRLLLRVVVTSSAEHFLDSDVLEDMMPVYRDVDEWSLWKGRGDPVLHIELRKWADALLVAPLSANSLAKIANGLSDNLFTSIVRAWDPRKTVYFAPAMNTFMWDSPLTPRHLDILTKQFGYKQIPPIEKELMCGDKGYGAMATPVMIASILVTEIKNKFAVYSSID